MSSDTEQSTLGKVEAESLSDEERLHRAHDLADEANADANTPHAVRLTEIATSRLANILTAGTPLSPHQREAIHDTEQLLASIAETRTACDDTTQSAREAHQLLQGMGQARTVPDANGGALR